MSTAPAMPTSSGPPVQSSTPPVASFGVPEPVPAPARILIAATHNST